jgi:hypothetical protein
MSWLSGEEEQKTQTQFPKVCLESFPVGFPGFQGEQEQPKHNFQNFVLRAFMFDALAFRVKNTNRNTISFP